MPIQRIPTRCEILALRQRLPPTWRLMPKAQSAPKDDLAKVKPATRTARAEAPPKKKRVTRTQPPVEDRQNNTGSHFSGVREFGLSGAN